MNKLFTIILIALLSLPVCVWAVDENAQTEDVVPIVNTLDEDIVPQEQVVENQYKQPFSKRKIAKKFLAAMGGVGISSFAIFFMLTVYNRMREGLQNRVKTPDGEVSLETPQDMNSATRVFLDKTKWF